MSARSMPASSSASASIAWPTVKSPPASSQDVSMPGVEALVGERVLVEHGHLVTGRERAARDHEPTLPAPTMSTNTAPDSSRSAVRRAAARSPAPAAGGASADADVRRGRRGEDHLARRLGDHVLRDLPHEVVHRPAAAAQQRAAADLRRLLGGQHDRLAPRAAAPPRRSPAPRAGRGRWRWRPRRPRTPPPPPWRARSAARARCSWASGSRASIGSDIGTSKTHSASIVAPCLGVEVVVLLARRAAAGGLHDVVVQRRAEERHEDRAVLAARASLARRSAALGHQHALGQRLALGACGRRRRAAGRRAIQPKPDVARARVQDDHADPGDARQDRADHRRQRQLAAAERARQAASCTGRSRSGSR